MAVAPARHVAAGGLHGHQALAGPETGRKLDLEFLLAGQLRLSEAPHPVVGEADVVLQALRHPLPRRRDLGPGHQDLAVPAVELPAVVRGLGLAAGLNLGQHRRNGVADVSFAGGGRAARLLQIGDGHALSLASVGSSLVAQAMVGRVRR